MNLQVVEKIIEKHRGKVGGIISMLEDIQAKYRYLPKEALVKVAERTRKPLVDIYGIATFYKAFSLKPRGKHLVIACQGTACHVRGGVAIAEELSRQLGIPPGETTQDKEFSLDTVACLGACALGPIVVVDGHYFSQVKRQQVKGILDQVRAGLDRTVTVSDQTVFPIEGCCPRCNRSLMDADHQIDGRPSILVTASFGRQHGWLSLSSLYGSYHVDAEHEIPEDAVVNFFCPYCHGELMGDTPCPECSAPMVSFGVPGGGMVQICSRRGCRSHMLDLNGVNL